MREIYNLLDERLASINNVKNVNNDKDVNNDNNDKEVKDDKDDKHFALARLRALSAKSSADMTSSSSLGKPIDEVEPLDSKSKEKWLCEGPAKDHWARFRAQLFLQTTGRGDEWKLKLLMTTENNKQVELMATLGRKWDFLRGLPRDVTDNDPWYLNVAPHIDQMQKGDRCGKFYLANTKTNSKQRRSTETQSYTTVILHQEEQGVYTAELWLWNGYWKLTLTDTFLTEAQQRKNMLANTQWFNGDSQINHKQKTALDIIGWKK